MSKTLIGGDTVLTIPEGTVAALVGLDVTVSGYGSAQLAFDSGGDLNADFAITGGFLGATDTILHQGSGLTFSDANGSITISDFRIDTRQDIVYGDVSLTTGGTTTQESDVDLLKIGSGLSLTFTADAIAAVNDALGSALTTAVAVGTAAINPITNPLPVWLEENSYIRGLFHDHGFQGGTQPIVAGRTLVTLTAGPALTSLGVKVSPLGSAMVRPHGGQPIAVFGITEATEQATGDVILHEGSGLQFSNSTGSVQLRNLIVDTIHDVVDADVLVNNKFVGDIAVLTLGAGGSLALTAAAAGALDTTLGLGGALTAGEVIGSAATHPFALTHHEAAILGSLSHA